MDDKDGISTGITAAEEGGPWVRRSPMETGPFGRCPRCGKGHIFRGFLTVRDHCEICGLNYDFADPADGPAVFVQLFACVPGVVFIIMLEILARPGLWVHLAVGVPVLILTTVLPLRPIKGWLIAAQYVNKAQEAGTAQLWAKLHGDRPRD
ncbi:protein of unknown function DUF983 [Sphingobium chlorophenolicum L-1]|uniref:DUF983 domain-containing protein n=1 Tax=Sphingobium chlorophenolicum L-1 TaxID=690566 RepID=F6EZE1_SPHCR|nr:DUF983 domain-containing protein [Sphingobium chlorophenolicum]AEG48417.1 protein of unknown function DUF983 [Sphingobium chlorophenolicum L-1]